MLETFEEASLEAGIMSKHFLFRKSRLEDCSFQHSTQSCLEEMEKATKLAPKQRLNPMPLPRNYQVDKSADKSAELLRMGLEMWIKH